MALSEIPTRLVPGTALTGSSADLYTAPAVAGVAAVIRNIHLCNTTGADRAVTLGIGSLGTVAGLLYSSLPVPANDSLTLDVYIFMASGEVLKGLSSLSGGVSITVAGIT